MKSSWYPLHIKLHLYCDVGNKISSYGIILHVILFPKTVITHTWVHQTVGESGCRWNNLSIVEVQLHQIHLLAEDIDMY